MDEALHFSGGLDSLATLYQLKSNWENMYVIWVNTGAAYDDTIALMERVKSIVPHFMEVKSNQPLDIEINGAPADLLPVRATKLGHLIYGTEPAMAFQSTWACCNKNIWAPLAKRTAELGIKTVYRGQRMRDRLKSPIPSGTVDENGVMYLFPIETWTRAEVQDYVRRECPQFYPAYYDAGEATSRDCWSCTGYLFDNATRIGRLPAQRRKQVCERLEALYMASIEDRSALAAAREMSRHD
jgi:3'-phosphoadenosine 5'-phosphosulfate sulfotransferase (PAPS reductase)/FAD synthetase